MALPTKEELERFDYAKDGGPLVRVHASRSVVTAELDIAKDGGPILSTEYAVPATRRGRVGAPYPTIKNFLRTTGVAGSYFYGSTYIPRLVFPDGGGIGTFSGRFWIRRPIVPVIPAGTLLQVVSGNSKLTVTGNADATVTVSVTDGVDTVTLDVPGSLAGYDWSALTLTHIANTLTAVLDGVVVTADLSSLTVPDADTNLTTTIGASFDGSQYYDTDVIPSGWYGEVLGIGEIGSLDNAGPTHDPGNAYETWDGTKEPDYLYIDTLTDGAVPNAGTEEVEGVLIPADATAEVQPLPYDDGEKKRYEGPQAEVQPDVDPWGGPQAEVQPNADEEEPQSGYTIEEGVVDEVVPEHRKRKGGGGETTADGDFEGGLPLYSDEGGYEINLRRVVGLWPSLGPYRVQLVKENDGKLYPLGQEGCFSCVPGFGMDCYANRSRRAIRFALPSLPSGVYGVRVSLGGVVIANVNRVLRVVPRLRAWPEAYSISKNLGAYGRVAGVQDVRAEPQATDSNRPPYSPWEALTRAFGRAVREVSGSPTTRLRLDHVIDDAVLKVESVLAFPARGWVWIDGQSLEYRARDVGLRELTLLTPLDVGFPGNTPVVFDAQKTAHPGIWREPDPITSADAVFYRSVSSGTLTATNPLVGDQTWTWWQRLDPAFSLWWDEWLMMWVGAEGGVGATLGDIELTLSAPDNFVINMTEEDAPNPTNVTQLVWKQFTLVQDTGDIRLYIDDELWVTATGAAGVLEGNITLLGAVPRDYVDAANIKGFGRVLTYAEIQALAYAGRKHLAVNAAPGWAGETPDVEWRQHPVGGVVANSGSGGVAPLTLNGDATTVPDP